MLALRLSAPEGRPLSLLTIGAHPDDIEIGAGGTLLTLAESQPGLQVRYVVLTGTADRQLEARNAAHDFLPGADVAIELHDLPEGRLPAVWSQAKEILEAVARSCSPDVILAPARGDAHQDHRTIGEIVPTVFRDQLYLAYEIPKWDGDLGQPGMYFPLSATVARRKAELLHKVFPSQRARDWWDDEVFLGLARLRGMECRAPYAEAFTCVKSLILGQFIQPVYQGQAVAGHVAAGGIGASAVGQRPTRRFVTTAAKLAFYRSYRDTGSYDAMRRAGVDVTNDHVYPDLVFAFPAPLAGPGDPLTVGVGIMAYQADEDRGPAAEVHASYVEKMKRSARWLADNGYRIRLFPGDNRWDGSVAAEILADLRVHRPDLEPIWAAAGAVTSLDALMREMAPVGTVVGIRYHNLVCALKLGKPTLSLSYARKHDLLMADMGLSEFCLPARTFDVDRLIERFTELRSRAAELTPAMADRSAEKARLLDQQFAELSRLLFPARQQAQDPVLPRP